MSTGKAQTLNIKDFRGINRFNDGTVTPPNEFYSTKNMHPVNRGEYQSIGGVSSLTATAMPGVSSIVHTEWLDQSFGDTKLIAFFIPSEFGATSLSLASVTSAKFSTSGGGAVNYDIMVTYLGPGACLNNIIITPYALQANGFVFTTPLDVPDYVAAIDFHIRPTAGGASRTYMWVGTMSRRAGVFASTITCGLDARAATPAVVPDVDPTVFTATFSNVAGSLVGGRQYYVALAPYLAQTSSTQAGGGRETRAYVATSGTQFFSFTLPTSTTSVKLTFDFAASPSVTAGSNVTKWVLFLGVTPEDMLAVCDTTNGNITPILDATIRAGIVVKEIPYSSRNTVHMISSGDLDQGGAGLDATSARDLGIYKNLQVNLDNDFTDTTTTITPPHPLSPVGAWAITALPFSLSTSYQILNHYNEKNFIRETSTVNPSLVIPVNSPIVYFGDISTFQIRIKQYADRLYCANNENVMFYTNGYVLKTVVRDSGGSYIPICQHIGLVNDVICLGGGDESFANTNNQVFFSEVANPNSFGVSPVWNTFNVNSGDGAKINGFGLYSQDLSSTGSNTFLLISKSGSSQALFSWNGLSGTDLVVSFIDRIGFAGPKAFTQTRFGPVFISRHGAYLVSNGSHVSPIGEEIKDITEALSEANLELINVTYHENRVKVGYTSSSGLDRELWLELRQEADGIQKFWSGPHALQSFVDQCSIGFFGSALDYRVSCSGANLYRRDTGNTNVGANIAREFVISRLGLQAEHFKKLLEWIYLSVKITQNETFTFILDQEDGTTQFTFTGTALFATAARQLLQAKFTSRVAGRIEKLTIQNTSGAAISIFDISMLFKVQRRRLLGL